MDDARKVLAYRGAGLLLVTAVTAASSVWGDSYPVLHIVAAGVCWAVGKVVGVPADSVIKLALQLMHPEKAVGVALGAIRSLPPERAASATHELITSIPPESRQRVVELLNVDSASEPPPDNSARRALAVPRATRLPLVSEGPKAPPPTGASPHKPTGDQ